jgi:cell fate regulator YaaT (PSP1 superfamily)
MQYNLELNKYEKHNYLDVIKDYSENDLLVAFTNVKEMLK